MAKSNVSLSFDVHDDIAKMKRDLSQIPGGVKRASTRAINKTLTTLKAEGTRIARETYTAKASSFRKGIRIRKASWRDPNGRITFTGKTGTPLYSFRVKPKKQNFKGIPIAKRKPWDGITAMLKKDGTYKTRYGKGGMKTFIATTRYGQTGVFYRLKTPGSRGGALGMAFGPGTILALMRRQSQQRMNDKANDALRKNLAHEMDAILKGYTK